MCLEQSCGTFGLTQDREIKREILSQQLVQKTKGRVKVALSISRKRRHKIVIVMKKDVNHMASKTGFDNEKYLQEQTAAILERVNQFNNKLYLEFGGKLLFDYHAARAMRAFFVGPLSNSGMEPLLRVRILRSCTRRRALL